MPAAHRRALLLPPLRSGWSSDGTGKAPGLTFLGLGDRGQGSESGLPCPGPQREEEAHVKPLPYRRPLGRKILDSAEDSVGLGRLGLKMPGALTFPLCYPA